jgi:acyl-CoA synthetase (AMP-forming)/AMP-acid ligase II
MTDALHDPPLDPALAAARAYTLVTQLARHAHQMPDAPAIRYQGRTVTWKQLDDRVARLASALADRGVGHGDRVAIIMLNNIEYMEATLALSRIGAITVPVNFRLVADEIAWILDNAGATGLVVDAMLAPLGKAVRERMPIPLCLVVGDDPETAGPGAEPYEEVLASGDPTRPPATVSESETVLLMYTSGTTGRPKGAMLSHLNLLMNALVILRGYRSFADDDVSLVASPLFHIAGIGILAPMMLTGGTVVLMPTVAFDPVATIDLIEHERITSAFLVPTMWQAVCNVPGIRDRNLSLRTLAWGASPAPEATLRAMAETFPGLPNVAFFGQTEMSPVTCVLDGEDAIRKLGSVTTVAVRIVDDEMNDVPRGEVGEIVYRGPSMMSGYWRNPQATAEACEGGWFHSGDLVREDEDGFIYVVDRKKDMIISGGENIYCAEVESVLADHPKVYEVALIGVPHPEWVETPLAVITPVDKDDPPTLEEITAWCRDRLASYKKPTAIEIVDALPRNASGKIRKVDLRDTYR